MTSGNISSNLPRSDYINDKYLRNRKHFCMSIEFIDTLVEIREEREIAIFSF